MAHALRRVNYLAANCYTSECVLRPASREKLLRVSRFYLLLALYRMVGCITVLAVGESVESVTTLSM